MAGMIHPAALLIMWIYYAKKGDVLHKPIKGNLDVVPIWIITPLEDEGCVFVSMNKDPHPASIMQMAESKILLHGFISLENSIFLSLLLYTGLVVVSQKLF